MGWLGALLASLSLATAIAATAQGGWPRSRGFAPQPEGTWATPDTLDTGAFQFCRLVFRQAPDGDGDGWGVDFPRADENLSTRLSELTKAPVSVEETGQPAHLLVRLGQPELFRCPFVMMTEPGGAHFDEAEASALRDYLLKGGFLWVDDFWGESAWQSWERQLRKALPSQAYPIVDLRTDHAIFRLDFGDAFEEEAASHAYFERFSVPGYAFGVNVLLYEMTH